MKKRIVINNEKKLKAFYKKLFLYRSFLFKLVKFKLESNDESLYPIIEALNIKGRKQRITYIYNEACQKIDSYYKDKNLCDFKNGKCIAHRKNKIDKENGCCRLCEHRTCGLCPSRNIACKLFYCSTVKDKNKVIEFCDIEILRVLTPLQRFILKSDYFSLEKDVINDLYFGIFAPFRIMYRFTKYKIKLLLK